MNHEDRPSIQKKITMKAKSRRDFNAPKRSLSAYLEMREMFKTRNPTMTFRELSKYTSSMYDELSESEKSARQIRAEADKTRYLMELSSYIPPRGYDARGAAILRENMNGVKSNRSSYGKFFKIRCNHLHE